MSYTQIKNAMVRIVSEGPTGRGTKIIREDGSEIHGVRKAVITLDHKQVSIADLEIVTATFRGKAKPRFHVLDPLSGELKAVKRIEFEDGSEFKSE
jgi:hypothetical protein